MIRSTVLALLGLFAFVAGCGAPSLLITPVSNTNALTEQTVDEGEGMFHKKIVIIPIEGTLMNARSTNFMGNGENQVSLVAQQLKKAAEDSRIAAVVLRINSPGGTVTSSDTLYQMVQQFKLKTHKPVIASAQEVAASGGYYVACASDQIVAGPTSVVGSIGVIFTTFDIEGTMGKVGVRSYTIKSGPLKDMGSPFKAMTPGEREVIQGIVNDYFGRFRGIVATSRKLDADRVTKVTDGRVFTGEQALALGLVDRTGTLEDAIDLAREKAGVPTASVVLYTRPYGYGGSIYASNQAPAPQASGGITRLEIPGFNNEAMPSGFYYLWQP